MTRARFVCLTYHDLAGRGGEGPSHFGLTAERFEAQLSWLRTHEYRGCSLEETMHQPAASVVALTFDDGHESHYAEAFPRLVAHGMSATFFVTTEWVGRPGHVTWDQLREMREGGMSIQSHTATHPMLSLVPADDVERELRASKERLERELGTEITSLALPGGDEPPWRWPALAGRCGYRVVATSRVGRNAHRAAAPSPRVIRRLTIRNGQSPDHFGRLVEQRSLTLAAGAGRAWLVGRVRRVLGRSRYAAWRAALAERWPGVLGRFGA